MAYSISLHTYKDADLIKAIEEAEKQGYSKGKATKAIMRVGIVVWNNLSDEARKIELNK